MKTPFRQRALAPTLAIAPMVVLLFGGGVNQDPLKVSKGGGRQRRPAPRTQGNEQEAPEMAVRYAEATVVRAGSAPGNARSPASNGRRVNKERNSAATTSAPVFSRVIAIAAVVVIVDQVLKAFARGQLAECILPQVSSCEQTGLFGPLRLIRLENAGSALGFVQGLWVWLLIAALGLVILPFIGRRVAGMGRMATLALGLQVGGALGNLVDRTLMGSVTDFIDAGLGVVFNPADVALVLGALMLGIPFAIRAWSPASAGPADAQQPLGWRGA